MLMVVRMSVDGCEDEYVDGCEDEYIDGCEDEYVDGCEDEDGKDCEDEYILTVVSRVMLITIFDAFYDKMVMLQ
jgi:hypothetical protein